MGWQGKENGELLQLAGGCGFDALITADRNMPYEQNSSTPLPVVVLRTFSLRVRHLQALMPQAIALLKKWTFRTLHVIGASRRQERTWQRQQERGWEWGR